MRDLITVIVNVYNGEKYISKCIESILCQSYKNIEVLIVNDGSTDDTLKVCQSFKDERIRIITQGNHGLSFSRNVGIENAKGKYVYFVDADDFIADDVIEYLYELCLNYKVSIATCRAMDIYDYNFKINQPKEKIRVLSCEEMLRKILLSKDRSVNTWNKLFDKKLFDDIHFENRIINDVVTTHKLVIKAQKVVYSNQIKYYFLRHSNSITANGNIKLDRYIDNYNATRERYEFIKNQYPNMLENDSFMAENVIRLYLDGDDNLREYLDKNDARSFLVKSNLLKMLILPLSIKKKIKIALFMMNFGLCLGINRKYNTMMHRYKM